MTQENTRHIAGYAGKWKKDVQIKVIFAENPDESTISIVNERGKHISTYGVKNTKLKTIAENDFWVLPQMNSDWGRINGIFLWSEFGI